MRIQPNALTFGAPFVDSGVAGDELGVRVGGGVPHECWWRGGVAADRPHPCPPGLVISCILDSGFRVQGLRFSVQDAGFRIQGGGWRVES